jgi:hypothetical protein
MVRPSDLLFNMNRWLGERDAVYLDTCAWSALAKGEFPHEPLFSVARANGWIVLLSRMQVAELSAKPDLIEKLADLLEQLEVVFIDRVTNEFSGKPWNQVQIEVGSRICLSDEGMKGAFVQAFTSPQLEETRLGLKRDRDAFRLWLEQEMAKLRPDERRTWADFGPRVEKWIRQQCQKNDVTVSETGLSDPDCYAGLRLSYAVLVARYLINRQRWRDSDYLDYLHAADMAYAKIVVAERNLAECLRQAVRRPEVSGPELIKEMDWLKTATLPPKWPKRIRSKRFICVFVGWPSEPSGQIAAPSDGC